MSFVILDLQPAEYKHSHRHRHTGNKILFLPLIWEVKNEGDGMTDCTDRGFHSCFEAFARTLSFSNAKPLRLPASYAAKIISLLYISQHISIALKNCDYQLNCH